MSDVMNGPERYYSYPSIARALGVSSRATSSRLWRKGRKPDAIVSGLHAWSYGTLREALATNLPARVFDLAADLQVEVERFTGAASSPQMILDDARAHQDLTET